ncbi:MAG: DnaB-like helicase C-terminal domain-containing protein, partial [Clostridiales bacterium]
SRSLKALAKELDVPVLALSQLSRLADRSNEPPSLSHLRESGALEQDADVVVFIHRQKDEEMDDDTVDVIVAKHRNGPVGAVKMLFLPQFTKFVDFAQSFIGDEPNFDDSSLPPEPF